MQATLDDVAEGGRVEQHGRERLGRGGEREHVREPRGGGRKLLRHDSEQHERQGDGERRDRGGAQVAREHAEQDPRRADCSPGCHERRQQRRQALPRRPGTAE